MFSFVVRAAKAGAMAIVLLGALTAANAQAPSANQLKLARQVVDTSGAARSFDSVIPQIFQQVYGTYTQQNPDLSKEISSALQGLIAEFDKRKEEIASIVAQSFAAKFSEAELNDIIAFYNSPTGKKLVAQHTEILRDAFAKTQEWGGKLSQELVDRLKAEMKKKGHTI